ncbi:MFS transporter [Desulfatitalea alkaliphila]|uniref:MFS transporter n=1 Tax=Desulfatitalea alkaliphila TaxID=2929485 RepID=A0AA41R0H7_9BACT|nr:MFS transporter [Desulfatitalea alkaliphila]MCJ8499867.1 MFS transporter [Desulfatitalea alkaliphila]
MNRKVFVTLFFSMFATITGVGIVVPLLPVYAHNLGATGIYIGLIFGAFSISRTFFLPYFGRMSDRKGRRPFIVIGLIAYTLASVAFMFSTSVNHLIVVRFLQGIASAMIMPVVQAYVGDITPPGREGTIMGVFNMSMFLGLSAGPMAGGLINDYWSLQATFGCMGVLSLVGLVLAVWLLPPTHEEMVLRRPRPPLLWRVLLTDRAIGGLFAFRFAYTAGIGVIWSFLPVLADVELQLSSARTGFLVMLGVFISGLVHLPMGKLADHFNRRVMVITGGVLVVAAMMAYQRAFSFHYLVLVSSLFGLGGGIAMPALMAMAVSKGQSTASMGSVIALLTMAHSLGMLVGALGAGVMMDWFDLRVAFFLGALLMLLGVVVFALCTRGGDGTDPAEQRYLDPVV